jgi:hypothetical protein
MRHLVFAVLAILTVALLAPSRLLAFGPTVGLTISPNPAEPGAPVTLTATVGRCWESWVPVQFTDDTTRTNLGSVFLNSQHVAQLTVSTLSTGTHIIDAFYGATGSCDGPASNDKSVTILADLRGYINPKYMVMGIYYVVPGSQSYAKYCSNTSVGTTNSITNTFTSSYQNSISIKASASIPGFLNGSVTQTTSATYTQSSSIGNSVAVTQSSSLCNQSPGPTNSYQGNNHDYDLILVWVNPVVTLDYYEDAGGTIHGIQWSGFGFNERDQPAMEVDQIYVGCLNGDLPTGPGTPCASNLAPLQRSWDTDTTWPSGQGPALNSQDLANVLAADPFGTCTPDANVPPSSYPTDNCTLSPQPARFTITDNENVTFQQPIPGAQPTTTQYTLGYTVANTQSNGYTTTNSSTFGVESQFQSSGFIVAVTETIGSSQTLTTKTETNQSLTTSNGTTMTVSVTGPPCVVSGASCNPLYPSSAAPGPTQFDVYEDTQYGTFFLYPTTWFY